MCKKEEVRSVFCREAFERMAASLVAGHNVKVTIYSKDGVGIDSEIETRMLEYYDMEMMVDILSNLNPDNAGISKISKNIVVNKATKLKADVVNVLPGFTNETLQSIAELIGTNITTKVSDMIKDTLRSLSDITPSLLVNTDAEVEEVSHDKEFVSEEKESVSEEDDINRAAEKLLEYLDDKSLNFCPYRRNFEDCHYAETDDGFIKTYGDIDYICIKPESFDNLYAEFYGMGFSRMELLRDLDIAGYLYHQSNKMHVMIHGMKFYAIKKC